MLQVIRGRQPDRPAEDRTGNGTFSGTVWANPILPETNAVSINSVFFAPGARTYWHSHTAGQVLYVTSGEGWVCDREGNGGSIATGDTVFIPPDVEHWHGADDSTYLVHLAISFGAHDWRDEVTAEEYPRV